MKNFHLPLPEQSYENLKHEAQKSGVPATLMARRAIDAWLRARKRAERHAGIAGYASQMTGTEADLDRALESATLDFLLENE